MRLFIDNPGTLKQISRTNFNQISMIRGMNDMRMKRHRQQVHPRRSRVRLLRQPLLGLIRLMPRIFRSPVAVR